MIQTRLVILGIIAAVALVGSMVVILPAKEAFAASGGCGRSCTGGDGSQASSHISSQGLAHMSPKGAAHSGICSFCT